LRIGVPKDKVRVVVDYHKVISGRNVIGESGQVESIVNVERERSGFRGDLAKFGDCVRVKSGKAINVVWFVEDLDTDDIVDFDELLHEVGEDIHCELDVGRVVE
jgi:hypothetical protein